MQSLKAPLKYHLLPKASSTWIFPQEGTVPSLLAPTQAFSASLLDVCTCPAVYPPPPPQLRGLAQL